MPFFKAGRELRDRVNRSRPTLAGAARPLIASVALLVAMAAQPLRRSRSGTSLPKPRAWGYRATTMFVRFRETARRLQVSLVETHRAGGRVRHSHVAGLGSVPTAPSPAERIVFWAKLHQRLATLGNRIDGGRQGMILAAVHARIPMPTLAERQAVQIAAAQADTKFWRTIADNHAADAADRRQLVASQQRTIAASEAAGADAAGKAQAAAELLARATRGEDIGVPGKPLTRADIAAAMGWTAADMRHAERLADIEEHGGMGVLLDEIARRGRLAEKAAARAVLSRARRRATPA